jgi:hypothetical protein
MVHQEAEEAGLAVGTVYLLAKPDEEMQQPLDDAKAIYSMRLEALNDDVLANPERIERW